MSECLSGVWVAWVEVAWGIVKEWVFLWVYE